MKRPDIQLIISQPIIKAALICLSVFVPTVRAQENPGQQLTAPPPPKVISLQEKTQLEAAKDAKSRIRTTLELAEAHLAKAQLLTDQNDYHSAGNELGRYAALIEDALSFLHPMSRDKNKTRDLYKRLELALRAHGQRLTAIRRVTPLEYAVWIKELEDFARKGRTEALNSFYGHTVVRDAPPMPADDKRPKQSKDARPTPENKP